MPAYLSFFIIAFLSTWVVWLTWIRGVPHQRSLNCIIDEPRLNRVSLTLPTWLESHIKPLKEDENYKRPTFKQIDQWRELYPPTLAYNLFTSVSEPMNLTYIFDDQNLFNRTRHGLYLQSFINRKRECSPKIREHLNKLKVLLQAYNLEKKVAKYVDSFWRMVPQIRSNLNQRTYDLVTQINNHLRSSSREYTLAEILPSEVLQLEDTTLIVPIPVSSSMSAWLFFESLSRLQVWPKEVIFVTLLPTLSNTQDGPAPLLAAVEIFMCAYADLIPAQVSIKWVLGTRGGGAMLARWVGASVARTPLVTMFDSDDYMAPQSLLLSTLPFYLDPNLDYTLGAYSWYVHKPLPEEASQDAHVRAFAAGIQTLLIDLDMHWSSAVKKITGFFQQYSTGQEHLKFIKEFHNVSAIYSPNSIRGWPNLAWSRRHNYIEYLQQRASEHRVLTARGALTEAEIREALMGETLKYTETSLPLVDGGEPDRLRSVTDALRAQREQIDEESLVLAEERILSHQKCHNGWATLRKDIFDVIRPPMDVDFGEDAIFSVQVSMSGLFTSACITSANLGLYVSLDFSPHSLVQNRLPQLSLPQVTAPQATQTAPQATQTAPQAASPLPSSPQVASPPVASRSTNLASPP